MKQPRPLARGPPLRCGVCGSPKVMAVLPGSEPVVEFGITLSRGVPQLAWCRKCWPTWSPLPSRYFDRNLPTTRRGRINP